MWDNLCQNVINWLHSGLMTITMFLRGDHAADKWLAASNFICAKTSSNFLHVQKVIPTPVVGTSVKYCMRTFRDRCLFWAAAGQCDAPPKPYDKCGDSFIFTILWHIRIVWFIPTICVLTLFINMEQTRQILPGVVVYRAFYLIKQRSQMTGCILMQLAMPLHA